MKNQKLKNKLLEELERFGNILNSCKRCGISTSTFYRWLDKDSVFKDKADKAIIVGRRNMTDFAEGYLCKNIQNGHQRAIEYALSHNDDRYRNRNETNVSIVHSRNNLSPVVQREITLEDLLQKADQEADEIQAKWEAEHEQKGNQLQDGLKVLDGNADNNADSESKDLK